MYRHRLHIVQAVRSDGFSGVERHVATLSERLAARGHRVTVIGGDPARMYAELGGTGIRHRAATTTWDVVRALSRLEQVDLVHLHMTAAELAGVVTRPMLRAPLVATRHFASRRGSSPTARGISALIRANLAAQISISSYVAGVVDGRSTVVPLGTRLPESVVPAERRERTILLAQRLEPEKRGDIAVRAWAASGLAREGWRLAVAGAGSLQGELAALAASLGVGEATDFLGYRSDVPELLSRAGLFLAPCPIEGFGLSVVEAMAAGTPVVAAREGAHAETVGSADGAVLFSASDPEAGGAALAELAHDDRRRADYGAALRAAVESRFTDDVMADKMVQVYESVLR
ncbi:glycosyltransferase family 4 protein [Gryllotalpicola reticulitermitis]|uniref:Glycosyltransferase family 4 protein n=1 Tax=Gryllotalpicola reticulitermitis TaxID=1184153 RepID=A0ABV8Q6M8_9MICO